MGEKRARTYTIFYRGSVDFRQMGAIVSRICTIFYGGSVLEIFASFDLDICIHTYSIHTLLYTHLIVLFTFVLLTLAFNSTLRLHSMGSTICPTDE